MIGNQQPSISAHLEDDEASARRETRGPIGPIFEMAQKYVPSSERLLGFVLEMSYEEATIITCDAWKRKCGGVPKNSFVVIRLGPRVHGNGSEPTSTQSIILARVIESVGTPVSQEIQQTIFEIHKIQAVVDPFTNAELQWSALRVAILGTYYDQRRGPQHDYEIAFGNDIDSYVSPHFYEVYVPEADDLETLVNSFVSDANPVEIGILRYTETQTAPNPKPVRVRVAPTDFLVNRTALFGKTRSGKSNTIKQIAHIVMLSGARVGQVIFDLAGEYDSRGDQDEISLYDMHRDTCVRYSFTQNNVSVRDGEISPRHLKVNFARQVALGHQIIVSLWDSIHGKPPGYLLPFLNGWEPCNEDEVDDRFPKTPEGFPERKRYLRAQSMYFAVLRKAAFDLSRDFKVDLSLNKEILTALAADPAIKGAVDADRNNPENQLSLFSQSSDGPEQKANATVDLNEDENTSNLQVRGGGQTKPLSQIQPIDLAVVIYERLYALYQRLGQDPKLFPIGDSGKPYFEDIHLALLRLIGDKTILGSKYLIPFNKFHSPAGSNLATDIVKYVNDGKTVIINLANADESVARHFSDMICRAIFADQATKFANGQFDQESGSYRDHSVLFYFEEAHNLFEKDDKNLQSIYNRLAKEGAKYRIGLVYGTQSMTTLSPDLMKNTENFFIAHLNDDREIKEVTHHYEFRDVGPDVQRTKTRGYVRMITLSHRFALPVQVHKFGVPVG